MRHSLGILAPAPAVVVAIAVAAMPLGAAAQVQRQEATVTTVIAPVPVPPAAAGALGAPASPTVATGTIRTLIYPPVCELRREQFADEYGWRVRDVRVCR
jgi:hypothetical protein